jgi:YHS domain-containing protein
MRTLLLLALPLILLSCDAKEEAKPASGGPAVEKVKDHVCGMMIPKATAVKFSHEGADYYFCADDCLAKFKADPKKYASHCSCAGSKKSCACDHCGGKEPCDCVK